MTLSTKPVPASRRFREQFNLTHINARQVLEVQRGGCALCGHRDQAGLLLDFNAQSEARGVLCGACFAAIQIIGELDAFRALLIFEMHGATPPTQLARVAAYLRGPS